MASTRVYDIPTQMIRERGLRDPNAPQAIVGFPTADANIGVGCAHHYAEQHELFPRDPALKLENSDIPYIWLNLFASHFHTTSRARGFYTDLQTGLPKERNLAEMQMLMVSELAEMMEGVRKDQMDTHLPHRKMEEVEAADLLIRLFDYAGYRGLDLAGAVREKAEYNARRADHDLKNRAAAGGKKF